MKTESAISTWKRTVRILEEHQLTLSERIGQLQVKLAALKRDHNRHMQWYSAALNGIRMEAQHFGINLDKEQVGNPPCVEGTCDHEACRQSYVKPPPIAYALKRPSWIQRLLDFILGRY